MVCTKFDDMRLSAQQILVEIPVSAKFPVRIGPYHSMSKLKILPVETLIQCEAGRAKTMQRQSPYSPRTPKWPPSDKGEFALVKLVDVKDLTVLAMDRRSSRGESVAVASLFGVVCAVTRRTIKSSEVSCYKRLIDAMNERKIDLGRA